ncbi:MAG: glycosyltransferase, partial [Acidimicrobiia bacterium]
DLPATRRLALVWAPQESRTEMFGLRLGAEVCHVHYLKYKRPAYAPFKYVLQSVATVVLLCRHRPTTVYVTNPPIFAGFWVMVYCAFTRCRFVLDTHSPSLFHPKLKWTLPLQRVVARRALVNVVDQERFRERFESWRTTAVVLERPPLRKASNPPTTGEPVRIAVVNTFAIDEPLEPLFDAARSDPSLLFRIMGDTARSSSRTIRSAPANVEFTGYLRGDDYWDELRAAAVVVALTTFEFSLLAGCQDAMAVSRPFVTSDQPVLRSYFGDAAVYVAHDGPSVRAGIAEAVARRDELIGRIEELADDKSRRWDAEFGRLEAIIRDHEAGVAARPSTSRFSRRTAA